MPLRASTPSRCGTAIRAGRTPNVVRQRTTGTLSVNEASRVGELGAVAGETTFPPSLVEPPQAERIEAPASVAPITRPRAT